MYTVLLPPGVNPIAVNKHIYKPFLEVKEMLVIDFIYSNEYV
jgi:hypothetical protein